MTTETLSLTTTGTEEVLGLADALDRYAKSQAKAAAAPPIKSPVPTMVGAGEGKSGAARATAGATAIKWSERRKVSALDAIKAETEGLADIKAGFDSIYGAALKVGQVVWSAGKAVFQAQAFREDVQRGLEIVTKTKKGADEALRQAAQTASFLGREQAETAGSFLSLMSKGFDLGKTDEIIKRLADLAVIDPTANLQGLTTAIGQIQAKTKLQGDELIQLNEAGLDTKAVYEALSKSLKKSIPDIIKMQTSGQLSSEVAIRGILDAIQAKTGGTAAGEAARKKAREDLSGLMRQIENIPRDLLFNIDVGPSVKGTMGEIIDFFDASTTSGKESRKAIGDLVNAFAEGLFGIDASKGTGVKDTLQAILDVVKNSKNDVRAVAQGIAQVGSAITTLAGLFAKISSVKRFLQGPLADLGIFGVAISAAAPLLGPFLTMVQNFAPSLYAAGANLMRSLGDGIVSTAQAVIDAVTSTVGGAISWAKQLLGIASPSKVFAAMGRNVTAGFAGGIASNDNAVTAAAAAMSRAATAGVSGTSPGQPGAPGVGLPSPTNLPSPASQQAASGPQPLIGSITIQVSGAKSDEEAESQGRAAFRGFASELDKHLPGALRRLPVPAARAA